MSPHPLPVPSLAERAYDRLEAAIVACTLAPGAFCSILELQGLTGVGRTPTHQAASRLAADTLVRILPRHGLQIAPVDLSRERTLLALRRDMERFVVRLAAERAGPATRKQLTGLAAQLRRAGPAMAIDAFNLVDRRIDQTVLAAAGEPFLEHALRPLHTIFRRVGYLYHREARPQEGIDGSATRHVAILDAIAAGRAAESAAASDALMDWSDGMFEALAGLDPVLFDRTAGMRAAG